MKSALYEVVGDSLPITMLDDLTVAALRQAPHPPADESAGGQRRIECASCHKSPSEDASYALTRVNVKGVPGVFICQWCILPDPAPPAPGSAPRGEDEDVWTLYRVLESTYADPYERNRAMGALHRLRDKLAAPPGGPLHES